MIKVNQQIINAAQVLPGMVPTEALPILSQMGSYPNVYEFGSFEELAFALRMRLLVIQSSISLDQSGAEFTTLEDSHCNQRVWRLTESGAFMLRPGFSPSEAIHDIFMNGPLYGFECGTAIVVVFYTAIINAIGADNFNRLFPDVFLYDWHYHQSLALYVHEGRDYLPGDCLYFKNPDVSPANPEWQGENAILLPDGRCFAHGIGIASMEEILFELNRNRRPYSTIPAYLTTHIISVDSAEYYPYAQGRNDSEENGSLDMVFSQIGSSTFIA